MFYGNFEGTLIPGDNGEPNLEESCSDKHQKYVACSYGYKLVYSDDKIGELFISYLGEDAVYNFMNSLIKVL